jgi:E3 ubiquitin-protein ligase UBR4
LKGFLPYICSLISKEIDRIVRLENAYTTDTSQGYVLMTTISLLTSFLRVPTIRTKFKRDDLLYHSEEQGKKSRKRRNEHHLLERVLDAFLSLRGIILNKTKNIDDSVNLLQVLLKLLNSESFEDNQLFMAACIKAMEKYVLAYYIFF